MLSTIENFPFQLQQVRTMEQNNFQMDSFNKYGYPTIFLLVDVGISFVIQTCISSMSKA